MLSHRLLNGALFVELFLSFYNFIASYSPYLRSIRVYSLGLNLVQLSFLIVHLLSWLRIWFLSEFFDKFNKGINYLGFHFA